MHTNHPGSGKVQIPVQRDCSYDLRTCIANKPPAMPMSTKHTESRTSLEALWLLVIRERVCIRSKIFSPPRGFPRLLKTKLLYFPDKILPQITWNKGHIWNPSCVFLGIKRSDVFASKKLRGLQHNYPYLKVIKLVKRTYFCVEKCVWLYLFFYLFTSVLSLRLLTLGDRLGPSQNHRNYQTEGQEDIKESASSGGPVLVQPPLRGKWGGFRWNRNNHFIILYSCMYLLICFRERCN